MNVHYNYIMLKTRFYLSMVYKGHRGRHHATASMKEKEAKKEAEKHEDFKLWDDGPNFDTNLRQNVVALIGRTAYLHCRVFDRGNKTVMLMIFFSKVTI